MTIAWGGRPIEIPGLRTLSFLDPHGPPRTPNCNTNAHGTPGSYKPSVVQPISGAVWHTVHGSADGSVIADGTCGTTSEAMANAREFAKPSKGASAHFIIADDGTVFNVADLLTDRCWHAGSSTADWNPFTIGTEICQHLAGGICAAALASAITLAWWLTGAFGLQPMCPVKPDGEPDLDDIPRLLGTGARGFFGHFYHAGQAVRGRGDPGPAFGRAFVASGAEGFNLRTGADLMTWQARQELLGMAQEHQDGKAGPGTRDALVLRIGRPTWLVRKGTRTTGPGGPIMLAALAAWVASGAP